MFLILYQIGKLEIKTKIIVLILLFIQDSFFSYIDKHELLSLLKYN